MLRLGNHDWRTSREAALSEVRYLGTTRPFYMDGIFYRVKPGGPTWRFSSSIPKSFSPSETVYEAELADDGSELPGHARGRTRTLDPPQNGRERNMVAWLDSLCANLDGALEDRHGASSFLVFSGKQVPAGSRPSPPDPANVVQICRHVSGRA